MSQGVSGFRACGRTSDVTRTEPAAIRLPILNSFDRFFKSFELPTRISSGSSKHHLLERKRAVSARLKTEEEAL